MLTRSSGVLMHITSLQMHLGLVVLGNPLMILSIFS